MIKARDMVQLAAELNEKLTSATSASSTTTPSSSSLALNVTSPPQEPPEEAVFIRSSLSQLGLQMTNVPVTNDMVRDEDKWVTELAKELAGVLKGMMKERGIIALDEVWGGWNRARGVGTSDILILSHTNSLTCDTVQPSSLHRHFSKSYHTSHCTHLHLSINGHSKTQVSRFYTHHPIPLKNFRNVSRNTC